MVHARGAQNLLQVEALNHQIVPSLVLVDHRALDGGNALDDDFGQLLDQKVEPEQGVVLHLVPDERPYPQLVLAGHLDVVLLDFQLLGLLQQLGDPLRVNVQLEPLDEFGI